MMPMPGKVDYFPFATATLTDDETGRPWYLLNGQQVDAVANPVLASLYPAAGGLVTLPDMRGRNLRGAGTGAGLNPVSIGDSLGSESGAAVHSHDATETDGQFVVYSPTPIAGATEITLAAGSIPFWLLPLTAPGIGEGGGIGLGNLDPWGCLGSWYIYGG